jgi:hypothetical protein
VAVLLDAVYRCSEEAAGGLPMDPRTKREFAMLIVLSVIVIPGLVSVMLAVLGHHHGMH